MRFTLVKTEDKQGLELDLGQIELNMNPHKVREGIYFRNLELIPAELS